MMSSCYDFTEDGYLIFNDNNKLGYNFNKLLCVINKSLIMSEFLFPKIPDHHKDLKLKIAQMAVDKHIKYLDTGFQKNTDEKNILIFYQQNKLNAIMYKYFIDTYQDKGTFDPVFYSLSVLQGIPDKYIRGKFLFLYITKKGKELFPQEYDHIDDLDNISQLEKYTLKRKVISNDKFEEMYHNLKKEGLKLIDNLKNNKEFKNYVVKQKIKPYYIDKKYM